MKKTELFFTFLVLLLHFDFTHKMTATMHEGDLPVIISPAAGREDPSEGSFNRPERPVSPLCYQK